MHDLDEMKSNNWKPNDRCVVMKKRQQLQGKTDYLSSYEFYRAEVISVNPTSKKYKMLLLDAGVYEENICENALLKLVDEFSVKHEFKAKRCYVGGVEPMGTANGVWSSQAKQYTAETLNGRNVHVVFNWEKGISNETDQSFEVSIEDKF